MPKQIFVNLPIRDLEKSMAFYEALGFTVNPQFTDDTAACIVISDTIYAMLLTHDKFKQFTTKDIADATKTTEVLTALSVESKDAVNEMVDAAVRAGGTEPRDPIDYGFMFQRAFDDLDGHTWEIVWMDPSQVIGDTA
ncbi:MAG: VOC family protein [Alphaproteobacteria bacterium]